MRIMAIAVICAAFAVLSGCRVGRLGKSVAKTQVRTAQGIMYTDSLFTDDGRSRLTGKER